MKRAALVVLAFIFILPAISVAKPRGGCEGGAHHAKEGMGVPRGKWWKMPQAAERLNLTDEEKEKLDRLFLEHRRRMIDLRSEMQKERLELEHLLDSTSFDSAASMARFMKVQGAQKDIAVERFRFLLGVREILGLDRFQQLKAQVREHRMKRRHMGRESRKGNGSGG
jgi:Spy/CpxP family protein refolding chaperone